ncbi:unnamed protein product [Prunus armeniaca]|nr:hypothetical protein GBA52_019322 [Prunus armeniaca]
MEEGGNPSMLPPSYTKIKKEQPEMLSEFDQKIVQPQEAKLKFQDENESGLLPKSDIETNAAKSEMLSGDGRAIKAIPLQMIPAPTPTYFDGRPYGLPEGWIVEQRLRTSLKYFGKIDQFVHEVKTRKRFRSIKAAKKWIEEATQGGQAQEALPAGNGSEASQSAKPPRTSTKRRKATRGFDFANPPEKLT